MSFSKRELETKGKRELQEIAKELGVSIPAYKKRADWIDAILSAQQKPTVQGPEIKIQGFKPSRIPKPLPTFKLIQLYPYPKQEAEQ